MEDRKEFLKSLSPEALVQFKTGLVATMEGRGLREEPGKIEKLSAGYASASNIFNMDRVNAMDFVKEYMGDKLMRLTRDDLAKNPPAPDDPIANQIALETMQGVEDYVAGIQNEQAHIDKQQKALMQIAEYGNIYGTEYAESAPYMIGAFSNYVIDPYTLVPLPALQGAKLGVTSARVTAKGLASASKHATVGGMIVGHDTAAIQLYENGQINAQELGLWTTMGAAAIPLITLGGKAITSWWAKRKLTGQYLAPQEVKDQLLKALGSEDAAKLAENEYVQAMAKQKEAPEGLAGRGQGAADDYAEFNSQVVGQFSQHIAANVDQIAVKLAKKMNESIVPPAYDDLGKFIDDLVGVESSVSITTGAKGQVKKTVPKITAEQKARRADVRKADFDPKNVPQSILERIGDPRLYARELAKSILATEELGIFNAKNGIIARRKIAESDAAWKVRQKQLEALDEVVELAYKRADEEAADILKQVGPAMKKANADLAKISEVIRKGQRSLTAAENMTVQRSKDLNHYTANLERVMDDVRDEIDNLVREHGVDPKILQQALDDTASRSGYNNLLETYAKSQSGYIDRQMQQVLGSTAVGGVAGGMSADGEGAVMGALAGLAGGVALLKLGKGSMHAGMKNITGNKTAMQNSLNRYVNRPLTMLRAMGAYGGTAIAKKFELADLRMNQWVGQATDKFHRVYAPIANNGLDEHFVKVMQGVEEPANAAVAKAVRETRELMGKIVKKAEAHNIVTPAQRQKMLADKTYWPRVYNQLYLLSKKGEERWMEKLAGAETKLDADVIESMSEAILGRRWTEVERNAHMIKEMERGTYKLSREWAKKLYNERAKDVISQRSTHLENKRKINLKEQDFLNEFLVQDPQKAMMMYLHDTAKRIAFAEQFGANDEVAIHFMRKLDKAGKRMEMEYMRDLYYGAVGSDNSSIVQARTKLSSTERNLLGSVNAFETLKLSAAQVLQLTQATVNGMTYMSKHGGIRALKTYYKGLKDSFTQEGRDFAFKTGAAVETTFMQLVAEASTHSTISSAFGKHKFDGFGSTILNKFNNPSEFLSAIGFIYLEKGQRILAANMGKHWLDDLLKERTALQNVLKNDPRNLPSKQRTRLHNINKTLNEMSIPPSMTEQQIRETPHLLERGAQAFSNIVNHTNSIEKLPLGYRGPYASTFLKFKSFAFHQSAFLADHVITPALRGELRPLIAYLGVGSAGMAPDEFRRMLKSDDSKLTNTQRYLRGLTAVGGAGIVWDGAINFASNKNAGQTWSFVGGPAVGDMQKIVSSYHDSFVKRDPRNFAGDVFSTVSGSYPGKKEIVEVIKGK